MKLRFREQSLIDLQRFIRQYEEAFFELYSDSGVWNEEWIIHSYSESAKRLQLTILSEIESKLIPKKVLGRKKIAKKYQELLFYVGVRLVIVYYSDDLTDKTRWVESIAIDRKPIIF